MIITGRAPTAHGDKYLAQLCKHWSHRFATEFVDGRGRIAFGGSAAILQADDQVLSVTLETDDPEAVEALKATFAKHLDRFAFREAPLTVEWTEGSS